MFKKSIAATIFFTIISTLCTHSALNAQNILTGYLLPAPEEARAGLPEQEQAQQTKKVLPSIKAYYGGYSDISNPDGYLGFPLAQTEDKLFVFITQDITPVKIIGETLSHFTVKQNSAPNKTDITAVYLLELLKDKQKQSYWKVSKQPVPKDGAIPAKSLILLTNPENLYIKIGKTRVTKSDHLVLPPIYVLGNEGTDWALIESLDEQIYFEPISEEIKLIKEKAGKDVAKEIKQKMLSNR